MKKLFTFILMFLTTTVVLSQGRHHFGGPPGGKLEELEKIKLIEILDVDEETLIRFFNRRDDHRENMHQLNLNLEEKVNEIEDAINSMQAENKNFENLIEEHFKIEQKIVKEREQFFKSLTDILTEKQIAKLLVFQKKFREDVRGLLMRHRKGRNMP